MKTGFRRSETAATNVRNSGGKYSLAITRDEKPTAFVKLERRSRPLHLVQVKESVGTNAGTLTSVVTDDVEINPSDDV